MKTEKIKTPLPSKGVFKTGGQGRDFIEQVSSFAKASKHIHKIKTLKLTLGVDTNLCIPKLGNSFVVS